MLTTRGAYKVTDLQGDSPPQNHGIGMRDFILLFAPAAAEAAGLSTEQRKWNSLQLSGLEGAWCGAGIDEQAMLHGKRVAVANLDVPYLQANGLKVRA